MTVRQAGGIGWRIMTTVIVLWSSPIRAAALFDEPASLSRDLAAWQQLHISSFSGVLAPLDAIAETVFTDVQTSAWYADPVFFLAEVGIVSGEKTAAGKRTGHYNPERAVTIAEILKMALEAARTDVNDCPEHPVATGVATHWAARYIACAEAANMRVIHTGAALTPDRPATRAEVLAVIHDAFGDAVPPLVATRFSDTRNHRYEGDIARASLLGMVSGDTRSDGTPTGFFRPDDPVNRAEAAKMLYQRIRLDAVR